MPALAAAVAYALAQILVVLEILQVIKGLVQGTAREHEPWAIENITSNATNNIIHPTWGLHAIHDDIAALEAPVVGGLLQEDVDNSIYAVNRLSLQWQDQYDALDAKLDVVLGNISAIPPPITPPLASENADAVWAYESTRFSIDGDTGPLTHQQMLEDAWAVASYQAGYVGFPLPLNPYIAAVWWEPWKLTDGVMDWSFIGSYWQHPVPDWSQVLGTDTVLSFLQRTEPSFGWSANGPTGDVSGDVAWHILGDPGDRRYGLRSNFTTLDMLQLAALTPPPDPPVVTVNVAPVWPGVAGVTLGSTVALTGQLELTGPMHGAIVNITTPPTKVGKRLIGNVIYDYNVGEVAFVSDRGDVEPWQYLGFRQALFTPKTMAVASSCLFRILAGAEGTARTFTIDE